MASLENLSHSHRFMLIFSLQYDPWGMNQWVPADYARKAELANGRSAMLATVGWVWPKWFGLFDSNDVTTTDPIDAIMQADPQWWAQFIIFCGTIEAWKYNAELNGKSFVGEVRVCDVDLSWPVIDVLVCFHLTQFRYPAQFLMNTLL
jgi:hypothetical protein